MLKIGLFTFGGGYAMIALLEHEFVEKKKYLEKQEFLDMVAIAESTPGPIAINAATFVGYRAGGYLGSVCATLGVITPSFCIILAISYVLRQFQDNPLVQYAFYGIRAGVLALIVKALWNMYRKCRKSTLFYILCAVSFVLVAVINWSVFPVLIGCALWGIAAMVLMKRRGSA